MIKHKLYGQIGPTMDKVLTRIAAEECASKSFKIAEAVAEKIIKHSSESEASLIQAELEMLRNSMRKTQ